MPTENCKMTVKLVNELLDRTKRVFSSTLISQKVLQYLSHRMFAVRAWSIKCRRKKKLIAQFGGKLRDERFEPN